MELDMLQVKINRAQEELPQETRRAINSVDWRAYILSLREKKGYSFEQLEDLELETELLLCGLLSPENYPTELEARMKIPKPQVDLLVSEMNEFVFKKIKDELIRNTEKGEMFIKTPTPEMVGVPTSSTEVLKNVGKESILKTTIQTDKTTERKIPVLSDKTDIEIAPTEIEALTPKNETISKSESNILQKAGIEIEPSGIAPKNETPINKIENQISNKKTEPKNIGDNLIKKLVEREENIDKDIANQKIINSISSQKLSSSFQIPGKTTQYSLDNLTKNTNPTNSGIVKNSKIDLYREAAE